MLQLFQVFFTVFMHIQGTHRKKGRVANVSKSAFSRKILLQEKQKRRRRRLRDTHTKMLRDVNSMRSNISICLMEGLVTKVVFICFVHHVYKMVCL